MTNWWEKGGKGNEQKWKNKHMNMIVMEVRPGGNGRGTEAKPYKTENENVLHEPGDGTKRNRGRTGRQNDGNNKRAKRRRHRTETERNRGGFQVMQQNSQRETDEAQLKPADDHSGRVSNLKPLRHQGVVR